MRDKCVLPSPKSCVLAWSLDQIWWLGYLFSDSPFLLLHNIIFFFYQSRNTVSQFCGVSFLRFFVVCVQYFFKQPKVIYVGLSDTLALLVLLICFYDFPLITLPL